MFFTCHFQAFQFHPNRNPYLSGKPAETEQPGGKSWLCFPEVGIRPSCCLFSPCALWWLEPPGKRWMESVKFCTKVAPKDGDIQRIKIWIDDGDFMFLPKNSLRPVFLGNLDFLPSPADLVVWTRSRCSKTLAGHRESRQVIKKKIQRKKYTWFLKSELPHTEDKSLSFFSFPPKNTCRKDKPSLDFGFLTHKTHKTM